MAYLPRRDCCEHCDTVFAEKMLPPPLIPGTEGPVTRPYWSVMIPTYKAQADYLVETLNSVLQQDPGPEQMQIEVVDDCSKHNTASDRSDAAVMFDMRIWPWCIAFSVPFEV
jgi:hypothetical protein